MGGTALTKELLHGRIYRDGKEFIIDAEPYVMAKIRPLFINVKDRRVDDTKFTAHPISVRDNLSNCRDLEWVMERFRVEIDPEILKYIKKQGKEYEKSLSQLANALGDKDFRPIEGSLRLQNIEQRPYQNEFYNAFFKIGGRTLLADEMGIGKTIQALMVIADSRTRPAVIVIPSTLWAQWRKVIKLVLPEAKLFLWNKADVDLEKLAGIDIILTTYGRAAKVAFKLKDANLKIKSIVMDEIQNLRNHETEMRKGCLSISRDANYSLGMSGTPLYQKGIEAHSVFGVINPGAWGSLEDFKYEWCKDYEGDIKEPSSFNKYLINHGYMIRRTKSMVGLPETMVINDIITLDASLEDLEDENKILQTLALGILELKVGLSGKAARDFDLKLRQATGVAKAKAVSEFVKMILEEEDKVMITAWHRSVYDILNKELNRYVIAMVTGSESPSQKAKNIDRFMKTEGEDAARILIISHISGAGIDGLQDVCSTLVNAELAWSRKVHEQLIDRLNRPRQKKIVKVYWPIINDGSDPVMIGLHVKKDNAVNPIMGVNKEDYVISFDEDVKSDDGEELFGKSAPDDIVKAMARKYLESNNIEIPEAIVETELTKKLRFILNNITMTFESEDEIQRKLYNIVSKNIGEGATVEREVRFGEKGRNRVDLLIKSGDESIVIECKKNMKKKADAYRQVRRYIEEIKPTAVIIVAPWVGITDFKINETPVLVISTPLTNI